MLNVGICDDDVNVINYVNDTLSQISQKNNILLRIKKFMSGEELITYLKNEEEAELQLLFLDVEMGELDGIQVKNMLSGEDKVERIVFVTSHKEAMKVAFGMKVMGFLDKPADVNDIEKYVMMAYKELEKLNVEVKTSIGNRIVSIDKIMMIRAEKNYCYMYLSNEPEEFLVVESITSLEQRLSEFDFARIHRTYIVNFRFVQEISLCVKMKGTGELLSIGRSYREDVKESYHKYIRKMLKERNIIH